MLLRFLPLVLGVSGAIAGMAITSAIVAKSGETLEPYASSLLSMERLRSLKFFAVSADRSPEGTLFKITPQSTYAVHSRFGSPALTDSLRDVYNLAGTDDGGMITPRKVIFYYTNSPDHDYEPRATHVWVPAVAVQ